MTRKLKSLAIITLCLFALTSISFEAGAQQAQGEQKSAPQVEDSWISNGQSLGPWWKKNSQRFNPTPDPLLYHLEGSLSYTKLSGNVDANVQKYDAALFLRKHFVTSTTVWSSTTNDTALNMKNKTLDVQKYEFNEIIGYDLSDRLTIGGGFMWKQDNSIYLDARDTLFLGASYFFYKDPPFILKLGAYYGYEDNSYMFEDVAKDSNYNKDVLNPPIVWFDDKNVEGGIPDGYDSDGFRLVSNTTLFLNERVMLLHNFDYMGYFKDSKYYHWNTNLTLQVGITKTISFFTRYEINYDKNLLGVQYEKYFNYLKTIPTGGGKTAGDGYDVVWKDTALVAGLQFSL
ncbi:MAG: DUF481 domain-containing protein [Desulfamplus sp.]|nr:DUF481 domain-containing protein [Desulfamplus sp.]